MSDEAPITPRALVIEDVSVLQPYDRQPGEDDKAWHCFRAYRDMHPRNLNRSGYIDGVAVSSAQLSRWYSTWRWSERAAAYDVLTDRIIRKQQEKLLAESVNEMTARHIGLLQMVDAIAERELSKILRLSETNGLAQMKISDIKGIVELSVKMGRLVKGESTEKVDVSTGSELLPIEEVVYLRERLMKAKEDAAAAQDAEAAEESSEKKRRMRVE